MSRKILVVGMALLMLALVGCGGKKGVLEGTIVKEGTSDLITDEVLVEVAGESMTTEDGKYAFAGISAGVHVLEAVADGYKPYSRQVIVEAGKTTIHKVELTEILPPLAIEEAEVPATLAFPMETDDSKTNMQPFDDFYMAKYQVTYELWKKVYDWATDEARGTGKYTFANEGLKGNDGDAEKTDQHPVTSINWRDAVVWCNALTEYYNGANDANLACVYVDTNNRVIRKSETGTLAPTIQVAEGAKGFRLPTSVEWEFAARYRGDDPTNTVEGFSDPYFTKGDSASGATANWQDKEVTKLVAWFTENSGDSTHEVGGLAANALGIYDMSGNVREFCYTSRGDGRALRNGGFRDIATFLQIGYERELREDTVSEVIGFRVVRTK